MKLYFSTGSCSTAPHIVMHELGIKPDLEPVDLKTKQTKSGTDFNKINPKGSVPALQLSNGEVLTEVAVIIRYLCDQKPEANLFPKTGSLEYYRALEWLNFVATDVHKGIGILWNPKLTEDAKTTIKEKLTTRTLEFLSNHLKSNDYLMGNQFTAIDPYLYVVLNWTKPVNIDLSKWPSILEYTKRIKSRPATLAAITAENPLK